MDTTEQSIILKHNDFIKMVQIKNQMTLEQQRVFDAILLGTQEMKAKGLIHKVINEGELLLDLDFLLKKYSIGEKVTTLSKEDLKEIVEAMVSIKFSYDVGKEIGAFVIFQKAVVNTKEDTVMLLFGKNFRQENLIPAADYTALSMQKLNVFTTSYSRVLYQYFKMILGHNAIPLETIEFNLPVTQVSKMFGIDNTTIEAYNANTELFCSEILYPTISEIIALSDVSGKYTLKGDTIFFQIMQNAYASSESETEEISISTIRSPHMETSGEFKARVVAQMRGKNIVASPKRYPHNTIIRMEESGRLSIVGKGLLSQKDEDEFYEWLYGNQERIGMIIVSRKEAQCLNLKGDIFYPREIGSQRAEIINVSLSEQKKESVIVDIKLENGDITSLSNIYTIASLEHEVNVARG